jgi:glycosyltransferase involved in cell wall biosynthesis
MTLVLLGEPPADTASSAATDMPESRTEVAIAACTVDRPDGLRQLLDGLASLTFTRVAEPRITVVIIDNATTPSAQSIVDQYRERLRWPIIYRHEPRRGLVHARNAQLETAPWTADWIAMIDDDEVPVPEWLDALLATAFAHDAPLVAGPVVPAFVESPPRWAVDGRFFEVGPFVDGAPIGFLYTGNALVSLRTVRKAGWQFEMAFNHSGGEDEHFFTRALQAGLKAVSAADARVYETIPANRMTARWVMRRYFRMGTTLAAIDRLGHTHPGPLVRRALKGLLRMGFGVVTMTGVVAKGRLALIKGLSDVARGAGALAGVFGVRYGEYRPDRRESR